ncbi:hypothetical protein RFI_27104 [Reticulomyxa filosa]|uniref:Uncharacterized protein n=1 Tax=Reticulomyxa filosa TaxID=46433 RepID=X6M8F6_RETFI|nr:hypothetical protein RFI_27104 [Reticulomyxa filosa]|eukprot:ETO10273.1 hypothetical protein RFI_27104 [Reticulomyxa filosa]
MDGENPLVNSSPETEPGKLPEKDRTEEKTEMEREDETTNVKEAEERKGEEEGEKKNESEKKKSTGKGCIIPFADSSSQTQERRNEGNEEGASSQLAHELVQKPRELAYEEKVQVNKIKEEMSKERGPDMKNLRILAKKGFVTSKWRRQIWPLLLGIGTNFDDGNNNNHNDDDNNNNNNNNNSNDNHKNIVKANDTKSNPFPSADDTHKYYEQVILFYFILFCCCF